jgi:inner membrane protein
VLAVASLLPDIDILWSLAGPGIATLERRTFWHSIFGAPLLCLGAAYLFKKIYPHFRYRTLWGLCLLACVIHIFFDLINSFGVALLDPLSSRRFELALLFFADPVLVGILILPWVLGAVRKGRVNTERAARIALILAIGYVGFCFGNQVLAWHHLAAYVNREGIDADFSYVVPEPFGPHRWSGLVRSENYYQILLIHSLTGEVDHRAEVESMLDDARVRKVRSSPMGEQVEQFFRAPVWEADGNTILAYDLRFSYQILKNDWDPFRFRFELNGDRVDLRDWTLGEMTHHSLSLFRYLGR